MKRTAALLLALSILLSIPCTASAAAVPVLAIDSAETTGSEAVLSLSITDNPGFAACKVYLYYNAQYFSVNSIENVDGQGSLLGNEYKDTGYQLLLYSAINITGDGVFVHIRINIASDTPNGVYPITLAVSPLDCVEEHGRLIAFSMQNGSIIVNRANGGTPSGGSGGAVTPAPPGSAVVTPSRLVCGGAVLDSSKTVILLGYGDGLKHEEDYLTRAQAATLIYRLLTPESLQTVHTLENSFIDVIPEQWFNEAVSTIACAGVVEGIGDNLYDPNSFLTWAQLVTILSRFTEQEEINLKYMNVSEHWCCNYAQTAVANGWLEDSAEFQPDANITRGETVEYINYVLYTHRLKEAQ